MICRITLKEIYKDLFRRSALIPIPEIIELLNVEDSPFSKWEVFYGIVDSALKRFQFHFPAYGNFEVDLKVDRERRCLLQASPNWKNAFHPSFPGPIDSKEFWDNCEPSTWMPLPNAVLNLHYSGWGNQTIPNRCFRYHQPYLHDMMYSSGKYMLSILFHRPFPEVYDEQGRPRDCCAVYFIDKEDEEWTILRDQIYVSFGEYINTLKKNVNLSNMPLDLFQGFIEDYQKVAQTLQSRYMQSAGKYKWIQ